MYLRAIIAVLPLEWLPCGFPVLCYDCRVLYSAKYFAAPMEHGGTWSIAKPNPNNSF